MKRTKNHSIFGAGKWLAGLVLVCAVQMPLVASSGYAADVAAASGAGSPGVLNVGDTYGGGKVAYIFRKNDPGYVAGQVHGLVVSTVDLESASWEKAIRECREYRGGGHDDWRLPSKEELQKLYENRSSIGGFQERNYYWSSTESDKNDAWDQSFRRGERNLGYKLEYNYVRPVRSF